MIFDPSAYQVGLELLGGWLTPIEARAIAAEALGVENWKAEEALMECIKGAQIELCASTSSAAIGNGNPAKTGSRLVPAEYWHLVQRSSTEFMQARAVFILRSGRSAYDPEVTLRCFRLVLNPFHVRREFPAPRKLAENTPAAEAPTDKYERKGHATDDQLRAWYAAYRAAYGGTARDTLPFAWDSALGMFPEKEVSRDAVRKVIKEETGPRDRGPKKP